jgi:DNA-formamidopyrimidine glycosylase
VPEGHTLHRLATAVREQFVGDRVAVSSPQGRFAPSAERVDGSTVLDATSHGKHLFVELDAGLAIHVHLGLYGVMAISTGPPPPPVGQVRLRMIGPRAYADLRGATVCELVDEDAQHRLVQRLGPDPLRPDADWERMWRAARRSRRSVAALLMDQAVISGIGNVYRAELLYRAGLDPRVPGTDLSRRTVKALWDDAVQLLALGVRVGRIDTLDPVHDPEADVDPDSGIAQGVYVYRRHGQPCRVCRTTVRKVELEARNLYWCPRCQRRRTARPRPVR